MTGQKIWTSGGAQADRGLLLARTDPAVPKHKGISCFLISMRQPGVEVRPLRQITGSAHFSEVFLSEARVERGDLVGRPGQGWEIAQTTLAYERGGNALARVTRYAGAFGQLVRAAGTLTRHGRPLLEDPRVRDRIGRIGAELAVQRSMALRVLSALDKGEAPGAASSVTKLSYSEFEKRYHEWAQEILGPVGPARGRRAPRLPRGGHLVGRARHLGPRLPVVAGRHDLRGLVRDPEERDRRPGARPAEGARADRLAR